MPFQILRADARSILTPTSGFIAEAGFTHSLTPARNCTFGCSYCYVPTMRIYGGLKPDDWNRWGQFTTFKSNAASLLAKALRSSQTVYCSPLVDPYQPAEAEARYMPEILEAVLARPPRVFAIQTRGPLIARDIELLGQLAARTRLRVGFSLTTDREDIRRLYEPRCAPLAERLDAMRLLREAGIATFATLAPLLPCDPERLAEIALGASGLGIIADPLHTRALKKHGATTRHAAALISARHGFAQWHEPEFQASILERIRAAVCAAGRSFAAGTEGFAWLAN